MLLADVHVFVVGALRAVVFRQLVAFESAECCLFGEVGAFASEVAVQGLMAEARADLFEVAFVFFLFLHEALDFLQEFLLLPLEFLFVLLQPLLLFLDIFLGVLGLQHFLVLLQI